MKKKIIPLLSVTALAAIPLAVISCATKYGEKITVHKNISEDNYLNQISDTTSDIISNNLNEIDASTNKETVAPPLTYPMNAKTQSIIEDPPITFPDDKAAAGLAWGNSAIWNDYMHAFNWTQHNLRIFTKPEFTNAAWMGSNSVVTQANWPLSIFKLDAATTYMVLKAVDANDISKGFIVDRHGPLTGKGSGTQSMTLQDDEVLIEGGTGWAASHAHHGLSWMKYIADNNLKVKLEATGVKTKGMSIEDFTNPSLTNPDKYHTPSSMVTLSTFSDMDRISEDIEGLITDTRFTSLVTKLKKLFETSGVTDDQLGQIKYKLAEIKKLKAISKPNLVSNRAIEITFNGWTLSKTAINQKLVKYKNTGINQLNINAFLRSGRTVFNPSALNSMIADNTSFDDHPGISPRFYQDEKFSRLDFDVIEYISYEASKLGISTKVISNVPLAMDLKYNPKYSGTIISDRNDIAAWSSGGENVSKEDDWKWFGAFLDIANENVQEIIKMTNNFLTSNYSFIHEVINKYLRYSADDTTTNAKRYTGLSKQPLISFILENEVVQKQPELLIDKLSYDEKEKILNAKSMGALKTIVLDIILRDADIKSLFNIWRDENVAEEIVKAANDIKNTNGQFSYEVTSNNTYATLQHVNIKAWAEDIAKPDNKKIFSNVDTAKIFDNVKSIYIKDASEYSVVSNMANDTNFKALVDEDKKSIFYELGEISASKAVGEISKIDYSIISGFVLLDTTFEEIQKDSSLLKTLKEYNFSDGKLSLTNDVSLPTYTKVLNSYLDALDQTKLSSEYSDIYAKSTAGKNITIKEFIDFAKKITSDSLALKKIAIEMERGTDE